MTKAVFSFRFLFGPGLVTLVRRCIAAILVCTGVISCSEPAQVETLPELPPVPSVDVAHLGTAVRARFSELQSKLAVNPRDGHYNAAFARLLHAYSLHLPAAGMYERCRTLRPSDLECVYLEALTRRQLGDLESTKTLLSDLLKRKPNFPRAAVVLADVHRQQGNPAQALPLFETAVQRDSGNLEAVYGLAMASMETGDAQRAQSLLKGLHRNGRNFGIVHAALANLARQSGNAEALAFHTAAATRFKEDKIPFVDSVLWDVQDEQVGDARLVREARTLFEQGKLREAADAYVRATVANPENASSHISLVGIYGQLGHMPGAQRHFQQARALNPANVSNLVAMGTVHMKRGGFAAARELFAEAVTLKPEHAEARTLGAYCTELLGETVDAEEYRRALKDDPTQSLANYLLGRSIAANDSCAAALPHLRDSVRLESAQTPAFSSELVRCLIDTHALDEARDVLNSGLSLARHYRNTSALKALETLKANYATTLQPGVNAP